MYLKFNKNTTCSNNLKAYDKGILRINRGKA